MHSECQCSRGAHHHMGHSEKERSFATPDLPDLGGGGEGEDVAMARKKSTSVDNNNKQASSHPNRLCNNSCTCHVGWFGWTSKILGAVEGLALCWFPMQWFLSINTNAHKNCYMSAVPLSQVMLQYFKNVPSASMDVPSNNKRCTLLFSIHGWQHRTLRMKRICCLPASPT